MRGPAGSHPSHQSDPSPLAHRVRSASSARATFAALCRTAVLLCAAAILSACTAPTFTPPTTSSTTPPRLTPAFQAEVDRLRAPEADKLLAPYLRGKNQAQALLLGEQHDAPQHQQLQREVVRTLLRHGRLGTLALEMAERGRSTAGLPTNATDAQVQTRLNWNDNAWPWASYGPSIMRAVQENVPVIGANLPRSQQRDAMVNEAIDLQLPIQVILRQQRLIEASHCGLLAADQLRPMARIQMARDKAMADTVAQAVAQVANPARTDTPSTGPAIVVLIAGAGHIDRELGVPQYIPRTVRAVAIRMQAEGAADASVNSSANAKTPAFDTVWTTPALPPKDYCAEFKARVVPGAKTE